MQDADLFQVPEVLRHLRQGQRAVDGGERVADLAHRAPAVHQVQGLVARYRAEAAPGTKEKTAAVHEGLERAARALAINAGEGRYLALRGLLESMGSRLETDPARRREGARRAVASLEAACKANPLLQREYGPALAEARLDAGLKAPNAAQR